MGRPFNYDLGAGFVLQVIGRRDEGTRPYIWIGREDGSQHVGNLDARQMRHLRDAIDKALAAATEVPQ